MEAPKRRVRSSTRIANGNSKFRKSGKNVKNLITKRHGMERKEEFESPRNKRMKVPVRPSRRRMNTATKLLARIEEEEEIEESFSTESQESSDVESVTEPETSNPMDMISAAATTVEYHIQQQAMEMLSHQCMVVQQDFDFMLAEKEEKIQNLTNDKEAAEARAEKAESKALGLYEELMTLKVKLFEFAGEKRADILAEAARKEIEKAKTQVARTSESSKKYRKRKSRSQSPKPRPSAAVGCPENMVLGRRGSF